MKRNFVKITTALLLFALVFSIATPSNTFAKIKVKGTQDTVNLMTGKADKTYVFKVNTAKEVANYLTKFIRNLDNTDDSFVSSEKVEKDIFYIDGQNISLLTNMGYLGTLISMRISGSGSNRSGISLMYEYRTTPEEEAFVTKKVKEAIKSLKLGELTDYGKVEKIHNWIVDNFDYALKDGLPDGDYYTAYELLKYGKSVCNGYTSLFARFLDEIGIENLYLSGYGNGGNHSWNAVRLNNKWYLVDVTWSDSANTDKYFLKGTDNFNKDHTLRGVANDYYADYYKYPTFSKKDFDLTSEKALKLPTKITIPKDKVTTVGKTVSIKKKIRNNFDVESLNPNVAKINSNGYIEAVGICTAIIRIKYKDNVVGKFYVDVNPTKKNK